MPPHSIAILGGGPGGYEAALVAAHVDAAAIGGSAAPTDCVPSKTLIETSNVMTMLQRATRLGVASGGLNTVNAARLYERITDLARAQSADVGTLLEGAGVMGINAHGRLAGP